MPNFINSFDASNIHILTNKLEQFNMSEMNLYTVHDCVLSRQ